VIVGVGIKRLVREIERRKNEISKLEESIQDFDHNSTSNNNNSNSQSSPKAMSS